jgi:hypothetical protein
LIINITSLFRGFYNELLPLNSLIFDITNLIFFYFVGRFALVLEKKNEVLSSLFLGIVFYGLIDLFLLHFSTFVLGSQSAILFDYENISPTNSIASFFGFQSERIVFPLASFGWGATHLGSIMGITFVASCINLIYIRLRNKEKFSKYKFKFRDVFWFTVHLVSIVVSFWMIILADSRAAFFACIISVLIFLILRILLIKPSSVKLILKNIPSLFISFYLFSFFYMYFKDVLSYILETTNLYRDDSANAFSSRDIIWESILSFFSNFSPDHIIGYGVWGHYATGLNRLYEAVIFKSFTSSRFTLHSTMLQQLIDTGYLGIFVYILLTFLLLKSSATIFFKTINSNFDDPQSYPIIFSSWTNLAVLLYLIIVGSSDNVITMERQFSMNIYLVLVMSSFNTKNKMNLKKMEFF